MKKSTIKRINELSPGDILETKNHKIQCLDKKKGGGCAKCFFHDKKACKTIKCSEKKICFPEIRETAPKTKAVPKSSQKTVPAKKETKTVKK